MFYVQVVDKAVMILTNDNLELACQVVEKTASDKAIREVDERLQVAYQVSAFHPSANTSSDKLALWVSQLPVLYHQSDIHSGCEHPARSALGHAWHAFMQTPIKT